MVDMAVIGTIIAFVVVVFVVLFFRGFILRFWELPWLRRRCCCCCLKDPRFGGRLPTEPVVQPPDPNAPAEAGRCRDAVVELPPPAVRSYPEGSGEKDLPPSYADVVSGEVAKPPPHFSEAAG